MQFCYSYENLLLFWSHLINKTPELFAHRSTKWRVICYKNWRSKCLELLYCNTDDGSLDNLVNIILGYKTIILHWAVKGRFMYRYYKLTSTCPDCFLIMMQYFYHLRFFKSKLNKRERNNLCNNNLKRSHFPKPTQGRLVYKYVVQHFTVWLTSQAKSHLSIQFQLKDSTYALNKRQKSTWSMCKI